MQVGYSTFDYHIIHIHLDVPPDLVLEHFICHPLVCCLYIFQSVAKEVCARSRCIILIWLYPKNTTMKVRSSWPEMIDSGKRVIVIQTCFVKIGVINTHSSISIRFFNQYNISKPLWILHFGNKPFP